MNPGTLVGVQPPQDGYALIYNNITQPGMSGGPVLNEEGQVIGIHGQGDQRNGIKSGLNLAIPIKRFLESPLGSSLITSQPPQTVLPVEPSKQTESNASPSPTEPQTEEDKRKVKKDLIEIIQPEAWWHSLAIVTTQMKKVIAIVQDKNWWISTAIVVARWLAVIWCVFWIIGTIGVKITDNYIDWFSSFFGMIFFCIPGFFVLWFFWGK
ncbi:hypothetical protein BCD67_02005 [Oscillatoriales cyanobacterium USR001]|nr:hypothetical protein BCD67_02005 [Oscillatoriales cyanobacterium USR001]